MKKKTFIGALIHITSWATGYWLAYTIMDNSSCRVVYGFIFAWWMACYIGYITNIAIKSAVCAFSLYAIVIATSFLVGENWFYHDPPTKVDFFFAFLVLANSFVFVSPILLNAFVRMLCQKLNMVN